MSDNEQNQSQSNSVGIGSFKGPAWVFAVAILTFAGLAVFGTATGNLIELGPLGKVGTQRMPIEAVQPEPLNYETWPEGSYAILANGSCPDGFVKKTGTLEALKVSDFKPIEIGESHIKSHENNRKDLANFILSVCVK